MLTELFPKVFNTYIESAMARAKYKLLNGVNWWGEIPECPGTNAYQPTLEECKRELLEVLEGWIIIALEDGDELPIIDDIDLNGELAGVENAKPLV